MIYKPPTELAVEIEAPDGTIRRWASYKTARDRALDITATTARFDGFKTSGLRLSRRVDQEVDVQLLDTLRLIAADGSVAWEGRVSALPRSMDTEHTLTVQAVGWMAHAKDRKFTEIYVDRDLGRWDAPSAAFIASLGTGYAVVRGQREVRPDPSGVYRELVEEFGQLDSVSATRKDYVTAVYGQDIPLGAVYYDQTQYDRGNGGGQLGANWSVSVGLTDTDSQGGGTDYTADLHGAASAGYLTASGATRKFAFLDMQYAGTLSGTGEWRTRWRNLAVYGSHGLTKQGSAPGGFYASDVIKDIAGRFCPMVSTAGVQDTTYAIPHLAFVDPIFPYEAFLACNAYHAWGLEMWENRTLNFAPVDLTDYDWQVRLSDHGVSVELQGDDTSSLANGIVVTYQDAAKGVQRRLTPDAYPELVDDAVENPANRAGLKIWTEIQLSIPSTEDAALQIGRTALAEFNAPRAPGTITVRGHIRDRAGHWNQVFKPRAGQTIAIVDHPNDRPRLITEASYTHGEPPTLQISVEGPPKRLPPILDRFGTALAAANLA